MERAELGRFEEEVGVLGRVSQPRTRWGLRSRSARIRPTWEAEVPVAGRCWAMARWGQWLSVAGLAQVTVATMAKCTSGP